MRHNYIKGIILFSSMILAFSCSDKIADESNPTPVPNKPVRMTFNASFEGNETRAAIADGQGAAQNGEGEKSVWWKQNDSISVVTKDGSVQQGDDDQVNEKFTLSQGQNTTLGLFTGSIIESDNYAGLYPHQDYVKMGDDCNNLQMVTVPSIQHATANTFDPEASAMVSTTTRQAATFAFKNVCAFIRVTPTVSCQSITLETTNGNPLVGSVNVNYNGGNPTWSAPTATVSTNVVVNPLSNKVSLVGNDILAGTTYYIAVLPQTLNASTLKISYQTCGKSIRKTLTTDITLERSTYYDISASAPTQAELDGQRDLYVDLGVSVLWATRNLGAAQPSEIGDYYAWGEIAPLNGVDESNDKNIRAYDTPVKIVFNDETYKWGNGSRYDHDGYHMTKYSTKFPQTQSSSTSLITGDIQDQNATTNLSIYDDAARVNWMCSGRMPTMLECKEIIENCYWEYFKTGNVEGFYVYKADEADKGVMKSGDKYKDLTNQGRTITGLSKTYNNTVNRIFIPFTGFYNDNSVDKTFSDTGYYWSSTVYNQPNGSNTDCYFEKAYGLMLRNAIDNGGNISKQPEIHWDNRRGGQCIRPVMDKPTVSNP